MNYFSKKIIRGAMVTLFCGSSISFAFAAQITIGAPERAVSNRQPIVVQIFLDPEGDVLSGLSGDFSFPVDMFTLGDIGIEGSAVSLWMRQPSVSDEKFFDNRVHITFEGIFPGGYDGVMSPYYQGKKPGILFSVTLIPKKKGIGTLLVDNIALNRFSPDAAPIPSGSAVKIITIPELIPIISSSDITLTKVWSSTLTAFVTRDPLVDNNAWYLVVNERDEKSSVEKMLVAETDDYDSNAVSDGQWRTATNPYVLLYQNRTKFIHVKIIYSNNTYATFTLLPVENSQSIFTISRILVGIIIVLSLLYFYGKSFVTSFKKKH